MRPKKQTERSLAEYTLYLLLEDPRNKLPFFARQYPFHNERRWRFDFAFLEKKFAVEVEGITRQGGRHQRMPGFMKDCEKYEAAMLLGWTLYRVPAPWVMRNPKRVIETIRTMVTDQNEN